MQDNDIGDQGGLDIITALAGSNVSSLNLEENDITNAIALDLAALIEKTNLLELKLPFMHPAINESLMKIKTEF